MSTSCKTPRSTPLHRADGVFTLEGDEGVELLKLPAPKRDDLSHVLGRIVVKTLAMVKRRGLLEEEPYDALTSVQEVAVTCWAVETPARKMKSMRSWPHNL